MGGWLLSHRVLASQLLNEGQERNVTNELNGETGSLRYLDADHVQHPSGTFAGLMLCSKNDEQLGSISGVLVEPASRCVRYFVVARRAALRTRHYLMPADTPAVLDAGDRKLRMIENADDLERFETRVEPFSEEDAITAMFARPAA